MNFYDIDNALQEAIAAGDKAVRLKIEIQIAGHFESVFENDIIEANFYGLREKAGGTSSRAELLIDNPNGIYSYSSVGYGSQVKISFSLGEGLAYFQRFVFYIDEKGIQNVRGPGRKRYIFIGLWDLSYKLRKTDENRDWSSPAVFTYSIVCDKSKPNKSLVHGIAQRAGLAVNDIDCSTIPVTLPYVELTKNIWSELSSLATAYRCHLECATEKPLVFAHSPYQEGNLRPAGSVEVQEGNLRPAGSVEVQEGNLRPAGSVEVQEGNLRPAGSVEVQEGNLRPVGSVGVQTNEQLSMSNEQSEENPYLFKGEDIFYLRKIDKAELYRNTVRLKINMPVELEKQEIWRYDDNPVFYDEFLQTHYPFKYPLVRKIEAGRYEARYRVFDEKGKERNVIYADKIDTKEEAENRLDYDGGGFTYSHYDVTSNHDRAILTLQKEDDGDLYIASIYGRPIVLDLNRSFYMKDVDEVAENGTVALNVGGTYFSDDVVGGNCGTLRHYEDWVIRELEERLQHRREFTIKTHRAVFHARVGANVQITANSEQITGIISAFHWRYRRDKAFVAAFKIREQGTGNRE